MMTMNTPAISVALSVFNDAAFLDAAIASIRAQTFADFEFLILDDGSTDGSGAIIDDHARRDPRIRAIHQENRGLIASLNRLIEEARAPLIARIDGDDIAHPERFARQIAFLGGHPGHGVLGTSTRDIDEAGRVSDAPDRRPLDHADIVAALRVTSPICHPSVMMRRDAVRAVGGYRAAYRHCEDYDLWLRLSETTRLANLPDRLLDYRRSESQISVRHAFAQATGATIARLGHRERVAGRPDPTDGLIDLPPIDDLDSLFGLAGVASEARETLTRDILYSPQALRGEGFAVLARYVCDGGDHRGLWRTVARLIRFGAIGRAAQLALLLATHRGRSPPESVNCGEFHRAARRAV